MFALSKSVVGSLVDSGDNISVKGSLSYSVENTHETVNAFIGLNGVEVIKLEPGINRNFGQNVGFLHNDIVSVVFRNPTSGEELANGSILIIQKVPNFTENRISNK